MNTEDLMYWQEDVANDAASLNALAEDIAVWGKDKGWSEDVNIPEKLMLIVTEVAEGMEEFRHDTPHVYEKDGKPEGLGIELADVIIRVLHLASLLKINMADCVTQKMLYNMTRPHRHGGLKA